MIFESREDVVFPLVNRCRTISEMIEPILLFTGGVVLSRSHFRNDILFNELLSNIIEGDVGLQCRKEYGHEVVYFVFGNKMAELLEEGISFAI